MLTTSTLREIATLTRNNHHTAALSVAARALDLADLADQIEDLEADQEAAGHLTPKIKERREALASDLFDVAQVRMTEDAFAKLERCF